MSRWWTPGSPLHGDARSLAALRIGLGALCLVDLAQRARGLSTHYTDAGLLPRSALASNASRLGTLSLHALDGGPALEAALFAIAGVLAVLLVAGWRTRTIAAALWVLTLSMHARNPEILYGGDVVLRLLLFWSIFAPLGACWSIDRDHAVESPDRRIACAGVAALLVQIAVIELFSGLHKLGSPQWREGIAVFRWVHIAQLVTSSGRLLQDHPTMCAVLARLVLVLQLLGPIALLMPLRATVVRTGVVFALAAMHVLMAVCLDVAFFSAATCVALVAFLPGPFWDGLARTRPAAWAASLGAKLVARAGHGASRPATPRWIAPIALVSLACVLLINVADLARARLPRAFVAFAARTGLSQSWSMAAADDYPSGWFVIPGRRAEGVEIDLFRRDGPVRWERPELPSAEYPDRFWSLYMDGMWAGRKDLLSAFAAYLCRDRRLEQVRVVWMQEAPLSDGRFGAASRVDLWEGRCD